MPSEPGPPAQPAATPAQAPARDAAADGPARGAAAPSGLRLSPLTPADLEACLALDSTALGGLWSAQQWHTELAAAERPGLGLWQGPALVGLTCGWLVVDELHITVVAVHPAHRRGGLGRRLLEALLAEAVGRGACHATLEVAADNGAAQALYGALGFQTAGVRRRYYRNGQDALIQWRRIGREASSVDR